MPPTIRIFSNRLSPVNDNNNSLFTLESNGSLEQIWSVVEKTIGLLMSFSFPQNSGERKSIKVVTTKGYSN